MTWIKEEIKIIYGVLNMFITPKGCLYWRCSNVITEIIGDIMVYDVDTVPLREVLQDTLTPTCYVCVHNQDWWQKIHAHYGVQHLH